MKNLIKRILFSCSLTHRLVDVVWNCCYKTRFFFEWRILGKYRKLEMRCVRNFQSGLCDLIRDLPQDITMLEIGSYRGESAEFFLRSGKVSRIYCIDPWKPLYDKTDPAAYTDMSQVEAAFDERFRNDSRVSKEKGVIDDFIARYKELPHVDFVYIDGCHTEEATSHDIDMAINHLRPAFAIAGHDYAVPGVTAAVNKVFGFPDKVYDDTSWIKHA